MKKAVFLILCGFLLQMEGESAFCPLTFRDGSATRTFLLHLLVHKEAFLCFQLVSCQPDWLFSFTDFFFTGWLVTCSDCSCQDHCIASPHCLKSCPPWPQCGAGTAWGSPVVGGCSSLDTCHLLSCVSGRALPLPSSWEQERWVCVWCCRAAGTTLLTKTAYADVSAATRTTTSWA